MPRSVANFCGVILGELFWLVVPKRRKTMATKNIMRCLGTDEKTAFAIAKKSVTRFGIMATEVLRFPVMKAHLDDYVIYVGKEHIESAHGLKRGGVAVTAHSGNWELLGAAFAGLADTYSRR